MKKLIFTIFGSTGDLTSRKLLPALSKLYKEQKIARETKVICLGRKDLDTKSYLSYMNDESSTSLDLDILEKIVEYHKIQITDKDDDSTLKELLSSNSDENTKQLFYLAIGPELFFDVAKNINHSGLIGKNNENQLIIFEKPFDGFAPTFCEGLCAVTKAGYCFSNANNSLRNSSYCASVISGASFW